MYAVADALAYPDFNDQGLQDTAVVLVRFDNGAIATAEASFNAVYGYDIRGEVFGELPPVLRRPDYLVPAVVACFRLR